MHVEAVSVPIPILTVENAWKAQSVQRILIVLYFQTCLLDVENHQVIFHQVYGYCKKSPFFSIYLKFKQSKFETKILSFLANLEICQDDQNWVDSKFGDGKGKCEDMTLDWCENQGNYSTEAKRACPKACKVCKGKFQDLIYFLNITNDNSIIQLEVTIIERFQLTISVSIGLKQIGDSCGSSRSEICGLCDEGLECEGPFDACGQCVRKLSKQT